MIHAISVTNERDETLRLELRNPWETGLVVKKISGLGPTNADIHFTELVTSDGGIDNSARLQSRDLTIELMFIEDPDTNLVEDSRLRAYRYFTIKKNVRLEIETDRRKAYTIGRIEKNESKVFEKNSGCQIVMQCPSPFFFGSDSQITNFAEVIPEFEFPFENNSLTERLIEMSELRLDTEKVIVYDGEADTGVIIRARAFSGNATGIYFYNEATRQIIRINDQKLSAIVPGGFRKGDEIIINTNPGHRRATIIRDLKEYNMLSAIEWPIQWIRLIKGGNLFMYNATSGALDMRVTIENEVVYEGV